MIFELGIEVIPYYPRILCGRTSTANNTLEVTFDPSLTFAAAKADAASNAPQRGR